MSKRRPGELYPPISPFNSGYLNVGDGHEIYYEECGNPNGPAVAYVHGGPGAGCDKEDRRVFNPHWRAILFDQRGSGRSRPFGSIKSNTTWHLVDDMKRLFDFLGVKKVVLFGGSWGSTLSLLFPINYPEMIAGLVLRGIFLGSAQECQEYVSGGSIKLFFPEAWKRFQEQVPLEYRKNPGAYYAHQILYGSKKAQKKFAYEWAYYEMSTCYHRPKDERGFDKIVRRFPFVSLAVMEAYYLLNNCFLPPDYVLKNAHIIPRVPTVIVQGQYDVVCPPYYADKILQAMPHARLIREISGHSFNNPEIKKRLIIETEAMRRKIQK